jgi:hypothetical protein
MASTCKTLETGRKFKKTATLITFNQHPNLDRSTSVPQAVSKQSE